MTTLKRFLVPGIIVALLAGFAITLFTGGDDRKHMTAVFPRAVSLYEGSDVRVLGVTIGTVDKVTPQATGVEVRMSYDPKVKIPADAGAVIISPSMVGDRYVQFTPVYKSGPVLEDGVTLPASKTSTPLELDEIYQGIDDLTVALGPNGANKNGALSDLLDSTARNWGGQGEKFHQTIKDVSALTGTLDDNKEELFGTAAKLEGFISTLAKNDGTVRRFNRSLGRVSRMLAGERGELARSLRNLATAMRQVSGFVKDNREVLGRNIRGLNKVSKVLVHQRRALDETLQVAPLALNNLGGTYNPEAGTLDTRANLGNLLHEVTADPATLLCGFVEQSPTGDDLCPVIQQALNRPGVDGRAAQPPVASYDPTLGGLVEVEQ